MTQIGIISDTHGCFDESLMRFLEPVDAIWHAGDFGNLATADQIAAFRPLIGVYGNIDDARVRLVYPRVASFTCEGVRVVLTHIGGYPGRYEAEALREIERFRPRIFISGHSHILKVMPDRRRNLLHINPGAAGVNGFHAVRTAVRLVIDGDHIRDLEVGEWPRR
ncbi:MAG: metallophosphatase family protein [Rikenellaceae bacterium]|jgi:putative phosphoesterase|nr:metallophosphatase family protein [Rikenellaceae bacterium]